jgi:hypothetical protein
MPSELDDLVLSQGPANKPRGLTFDDVPMRTDIGPATALVRGMRHGGSAGWDDELAGLAAASYLANQGGHAFGYHYDPKAFIRDALAGGARIAAERLAPSVFGQEGSRIYNNAVAEQRTRLKQADEQYPWTTFAGDFVGSLATPIGGIISGAGTNLGARILQGGKIGAFFGGLSGVGRGEDLRGRVLGGAIGVPAGGLIGGAIGAAAPAITTGAAWLGQTGAKVARPIVNELAARLRPRMESVGIGTQAPGARAGRLLIDDLIDQSAAEAQAAVDKRVARARPSAANDNTMPEHLDFRQPGEQLSSATNRNAAPRQGSFHPSDVRPPPASNDNIAPGQLYFDPPNVNRPFEADYPRATEFDLLSQKLLEDMDKVSILDSSTVIGRKKFEGPDVPLLEENFHDFAKRLTDERGGLKEVEPREMKRPGSPAETDFDKDGIPTDFRVLRTLSPRDKAVATTREFANAIAAWIRPFREYDYFSPLSRIEMRRVYNELGNPKRIEGRPDKDARPFTPADRGYSADEAPWEYLTEAVRGYLAEPGWLKSVAPDTAKTLRQIARDHFSFRKFLHLNGLAPMMLGGAGAASIGAAAPRNARDPEADEQN